VSIQKFANEELRALIRTHTAVLNQWAAQSSGETPAFLKKALLDTTSRLYECIEQLPEPKVNKHPKDIEDAVANKVKH
jgi:hypothetical protein